MKFLQMTRKSALNIFMHLTTGVQTYNVPETGISTGDQKRISSRPCSQRLQGMQRKTNHENAGLLME